MKRLKCLIIVILVLSLTGCMKKYTATDEQTDAIAEYMAGLLLESDKNYDQELISMDEINGDTSDNSEVTQAPSSTDTSSDTNSDSQGNSNSSDNSSSVSDNDNNTYSLTDVIGDSKFQFNYKSSKLTDEYQVNTDGFNIVLAPQNEKKLLVVLFSVKNVTNSKQNIDMYAKKVKYQLNNQAMGDISPSLTLDEFDLQYLNTDINAGKSIDGVLIFEVPNTVAKSDLKLSASHDGNTTTIDLK